MHLEFVKATKEDLDRVFSLFQAAIRNMDANGIPQWDEIYPTRQIMSDDIDNGDMYLGLIDGKLASVYAINREYDPAYEGAVWQYPDANYYIIHRICVDPAFQNQGVARQTMLHIEDQLRDMGAETIRFDAFTKNPYALRLYRGLGYAVIGSIQLRKGEFLLMEKKL